MGAQVLGPRPLALRVGQAQGDGPHQRVLRIDQLDVGPAPFRLRHGHFHRHHPVVSVVYLAPRRARVGKLACEYLEGQHAEGKDVRLLREGGRVGEGLGGHVASRGMAAHGREAGKRSFSAATRSQSGHSEIGDFGPEITSEKDVVSGEVAVQDVVGVEVRESQGHVVAEVDLGVEGERGGGGGRPILQEGRQATVHQFHEDREAVGTVHVSAEVLDDVGVPH